GRRTGRTDRQSRVHRLRARPALMAGNEVRFDIVAADKASKQLDAVADKAEQLEQSDPTVDVKADTKAADHSIDGFADQLDKLTSADQMVVLSLRAGAAQSELSDLATKLATVDASDPDIAVTFDRYQQVSGQLDDLESKIKAVGDADPDAGASIDKARDRLQGFGEEANKAQDSVHSMAGAAVGDFAATATGLGPLGAYASQLVEGIGAGEIGFHNLATAGLGLGAISGGMFALNKIMGEFSKTAERAAAIKAFRTADVDAFTKSLREGTDAAQDLIDKVKDTGKLEGVYQSLAVGAAAIGPKYKTDLIGPLVEAGVTVEQFAHVVTGSTADMDRFAAALGTSGVNAEQQRIMLGAPKTAHEDYVAAVDQSAKFTAAFAVTTDTSNLSTATMYDALDKAARKSDDLTQATADQNRETAE